MDEPCVGTVQLEQLNVLQLLQLLLVTVSRIKGNYSTLESKVL